MPEVPSHQRAKLILAGMTMANAMILVDQTAVPLALPDIMQSFHVGSAEVQWVLNASLLPLAGLLVLGGRLGDLLGRRRIFLLGCVTFATASAIAGLAPWFPMLLLARVAQGAGGALMLPGSVALVSAAFSSDERGRALGTMGGIAAVAGALGPTIGGTLTSVLSWRAVLLVNVPLAIACVLITLRAVPKDPVRDGPVHVDVSGSVLFGISLVLGVFGLSQTQGAALASPDVLVPVAIATVTLVLFVVRERRAHNPLMDFALLRRHPNYLGATLSQGLAGMAEMGLGVIFPLLLILNLEMSPVLAGIALIPTTLPMIFVAPLAGRWYDRSGGRAPLVFGFGLLAASGIALALGVQSEKYLELLPGLLLYGVGLSLVLTTNDPVSLDSITPQDAGQASGVSATAEQGGGAIGIAVLYALFHSAYVARLHENVANTFGGVVDSQLAALRDQLIAAEQTGLKPAQFDPKLLDYLVQAESASVHGYTVAFLAMAGIAVVGLVAVAWLVRKPQPVADPI